VQPIIDLALGTEENPLAGELARVLRANLLADEGSPGKARRLADFRALRGAVLIVAQDTGDTVTLRFDHGRLTVHDGHIGVPQLTLCGDETVLLGLCELPLSRLGRLPLPSLFSSDERARFGASMGALLGEGLTIYGLLAHPRMLLRLLRILSTRP
jgi:hypothetical protein